MFLDPKPKTQLQAAIDDVLFQMGSHPADSNEYGTMLDRVKLLHKLKEEEKPQQRVSSDTMILAATNLVGIAMILRHEQFNVITSKALGFLPKLR
jgi:hypothetical protein